VTIRTSMRSISIAGHDPAPRRATSTPGQPRGSRPAGAASTPAATSPAAPR
jgi:hypothetical protein